MAQAHELAVKDYILGMKYKDIAEKYNVSINTVKQWKKRYKWERDKPVRNTVKGVPTVHKKEKGYKRVQEAEPEEELSDQEQLFCYHYARTHNATQSALLAGYAKGSNKHTAQVMGCRINHRPRVKQEIERLIALFCQDLHVSIQDLLIFCVKVVFADIGDYLRFGAVDRFVYDDSGPVKDPDTGEYLKEPVNCVTIGESDELDTSIIQEVKQGKDGISFKLADKKWAWEQLIKYFDWLPDKWQREVEKEKLKIAQDKLAIEKAKVSDEDVGSEDDNSFIAALAGKIPEVWDDEK